MPRANPHRPYAPPAELEALRPGVTGNAINGLGEAVRRRPSRIYWADDPDEIAHGRMQRWFYRNDPDNPEIRAARAARAKILEAPMPEVAGAPVERSPEDWTAALRAYAETADFEMVGVAEMDPAWVFEDSEVRESRIVMIGVAHDYDAISAAPAPRAGAEVVRQYGRAGAAAKAVAGWLREQGWPATPATGPMSGRLTMIPAAIACGFGELGKHGSIINDRYGASFRLSAVLTDAPLAPTPARQFGVDDFCASCRICEDACPPEAILPAKQLVRGEEKWYVDFDRCIPFFNQTHGCAICIAACPWSRPGVGPNLAAKLARRRMRREEEAGAAGQD